MFQFILFSSLNALDSIMAICVHFTVVSLTILAVFVQMKWNFLRVCILLRPFKLQIFKHIKNILFTDPQNCQQHEKVQTAPAGEEPQPLSPAVESVSARTTLWGFVILSLWNSHNHFLMAFYKNKQCLTIFSQLKLQLRVCVLFCHFSSGLMGGMYVNVLLTCINN